MMGKITASNLFLVAVFGGFLTGTASLLVAQPRATASPPTPVPLSPLSGDTVSQCSAVDGDTLRCGAERIRLIGIDTPELPGHCRPGRQCVEGDPYAAKAALSGAVSVTMTIQRFGTDHYGRTLALVGGPLGDLSCVQLRAGHAIYRADWDVGGVMMKGCS